jgi:glutamate carboxypeptidase
MRYRHLPALVIAALALPLASLAAPLSPDEARIAAYVDAHQAEFAADLRAAVQIDSATENLAGVRQMGEFFRGKFAALGFDSRFVELPAATGRAGHLVAERHGTQGRRVLLIGHLDTVYPGANYRREGNIAHGAGVADMKGGDIVLLHALQALASIGALENTQLIVVFSGDEEAPGKPLAVSRDRKTHV